MPSLEYLTAVAPSRGAGGPWRAWTGALLDLLFPPFCPLCQVGLGAGRRDPLCGRCWEGLERIGPPWCRICGLPFGGLASVRLSADRGSAGAVGRAAAVAVGDAATGEPPDREAEASGYEVRPPHTCGFCRLRRPVFAYARTAARYGEIVRDAVHAFKFGGRRALAAPLGDLLVEVVQADLPAGRPDVLVPVPLHPRRERERGFNQALLLARRVGGAWGRPVRADVLARRLATPPQAELTAAARRANVRGAFALRRPEVIAGRHVVVVDDILTTGATVAECARCLHEGGAATVGILAVARVL